MACFALTYIVFFFIENLIFNFTPNTPKYVYFGDSLVMGFSPDCVHFRREAPGNFWGFEIISCWSNLVNIEFYSDKKAKYVTFTGEYQTIMRIAFCVHFRKFPILCTFSKIFENAPFCVHFQKFSKMPHFVYIFENAPFCVHFQKCPILCTFSKNFENAPFCVHF